MERFHVIQDAAAIIVANSVFKQVPVYRRGDGIYIGTAGGFVRLYADGNTGLPKVRWDDIEVPGINRTDDLTADGLRKLSLPATFKQIEATAR